MAGKIELWGWVSTASNTFQKIFSTGNALHMLRPEDKYGTISVGELDTPVSAIATTTYNFPTGLLGITIDFNSTIEPTTALSKGSFDISAGGSGSIDTVTIGGVEILGGVEAFDTNLTTTAANVAAAITANVSTPNYSATSAIGVVTITGPQSSSGLIIATTQTTLTVSSIVDMDTGPKAFELYVAFNNTARDNVGIAEYREVVPRGKQEIFSFDPALTLPTIVSVTTDHFELVAGDTKMKFRAAAQ